MRLKWRLDLVCSEVVLTLRQVRSTVCDEHTIGSKIILDALDGSTRWNSKVTWVMWSLVLVYLEILLVSVQDRCTVCANIP
jgi:hypothetical protein